MAADSLLIRKLKSDIDNAARLFKLSPTQKRIKFLEEWSRLEDVYKYHTGKEYNPPPKIASSATYITVNNVGVVFHTSSNVTITNNFVKFNTPAKISLERIKSDMPILAARRGRIILDGPGNPKFAAVTNSSIFGQDADATCNLNSSHSAPDENCQCGFYATPSDTLKRFGYNSTITLLVEVSGKVIEHEFGYRAEHQRILEASVKDCLCGRPATHIIFRSNPSMLEHLGTRPTSLQSLCCPTIVNSDFDPIAQCGVKLNTAWPAIIHSIPIEWLQQRLKVPFVK